MRRTMVLCDRCSAEYPPREEEISFRWVRGSSAFYFDLCEPCSQFLADWLRDLGAKFGFLPPKKDVTA